MMLTQNNHQALIEILEHARAMGDDEIADDAEAALRGDREALGYVMRDIDTRAGYAAWRAV